MADAPDTAGKGADVLTKKIGPLPVLVWLIAGVGIWFYVSKKNAAKTTATAAPATVTDPAGNVCVALNPSTGFCIGSAEDVNAVASAAGQQPAADTGTSGKYTTNDQWKAAALADLVGNGVNVNDATAALDAYLSGQQITTAQQDLIGQAIRDIGPPPVVPPPGTPPPPPKNPRPPVDQPPGQPGPPPPPVPGPPPKKPPPKPPSHTPPPPTGLHFTHRSDNSYTAVWNKSKGDTAGYRVDTLARSDKDHRSDNVSSGSPHITVGGLEPGESYTVNVYALPGTGAHASGSVTTTGKRETK